MSSYEALILSASEQRSEEWKKSRIGRATSSKIAALFPRKAPEKKFADQHCGFGKTAASYIAQKAMEVYTGRDVNAELDTLAVRYGRTLESQAWEMFLLVNGKSEYKQYGFVPFGDYAGGSPDGLVEDLGVGESKCPFNAEIHLSCILEVNTFDDLKEFNYDYWWQIQSLLTFLNVPCGFFMSFDPRHFSQAWTGTDWEGFSAKYAFENSTQHERNMALHVVEGELSPEVPEMIEEMLPRFARLRDRYIEQMIEKKGCPDHLKDWKG